MDISINTSSYFWWVLLVAVVALAIIYVIKIKATENITMANIHEQAATTRAGLALPDKKNN